MDSNSCKIIIQNHPHSPPPETETYQQASSQAIQVQIKIGAHVSTQLPGVPAVILVGVSDAAMIQIFTTKAK